MEEIARIVREALQEEGYGTMDGGTDTDCIILQVCLGREWWDITVVVPQP